MKPVVNSA